MRALRDVDPAVRMLHADLESAAFSSGEDSGRWRLHRLAWPFLYVAVRAGDGKELGMKIELSDYPTVAPAGTPWHLAADLPLDVEQLPTGGGADQVFRSEWSKQHSWTPYMATEREILAEGGHPEWGAQHPSRSWNPSREIAFYVDQIYQELRSCRIP